MRILLYAPNYLPATRYGGPIRSSHGLAKALAALGNEVQVFTTNVDGDGVLDVALERDVAIEGVRVRYFPVRPPRRIYYSPAMGRALEAEVSGFDIAHVNGVYLWPGPKLAREAVKAHVPFVVSPRGMLSPEMISGRSRLVKSAWIGLFERRVLASAAAIHVTSDEEARGVRSLGLALAPIVTIANGVELPRRPPSSADVERIWAGAPRGSRVAVLGRLDWTKGVDLAIEAVAAQDHAQILIAGPDQHGLRAELVSRLRCASGRNCGRFIGELKDPEKWALLAGADVLLAPSLKESFGMSVAEALAVGTPVICTEGVGAATIVRRLGADLVTTRTVEALAHALRELLADTPRRAQMGREAQAIMAAEFSWPGVARQMLGLYRDATARKVMAR